MHEFMRAHMPKVEQYSIDEFFGDVSGSIIVSNLTSIHTKTLSLLDLDQDIYENKLSREIQKLREKFGLDIIKTGTEL